MQKLTYEEMVAKLVKPGQAIIDQTTPRKAHLLHMAVGVAGEGGELLDVFKKHCIYGQELNMYGEGGAIEELGDLEFFIEALYQELGLDREYVREMNAHKLLKRYPEFTYTDEAAFKRADKI